MYDPAFFAELSFFALALFGLALMAEVHGIRIFRFFHFPRHLFILPDIALHSLMVFHDQLVIVGIQVRLLFG